LTFDSRSKATTPHFFLVNATTLNAPTLSSARSQARSQQIATRIVFFIAGLGVAAWAPLVPYAKARMQIEDGMLGLLLLCLGAGSLLAMPLAGALTARLGCRLVITVSTVVICLTLPLLATLSNFQSLMISLLMFGAGIGALDVSMNVQAIIVERASGKAMMSGFHGLFSVGGIVGAGGVAALLGMGVSPLLAVIIIVAIVIAALALATTSLLPYGSKSEGPLFALPSGIVLLLGIVCFIVFLAEGAVLDWSAVLLSSAHGMDASHAGLGYAAFALTMTIGRLTGDRIVQLLGGAKVVALGGVCAAAGIALATLGASWQVALLGYALVGVGCSNIVPVMFSAAGRQKVMPENVAVPAITTLGYAGILVGPAAIGFIAHLINLSAAFLILGLLLIGVSTSVRLLRL
jgi:fucose permease